MRTIKIEETSFTNVDFLALQTAAQMVLDSAPAQLSADQEKFWSALSTANAKLNICIDKAAAVLSTLEAGVTIH